MIFSWVQPGSSREEVVPTAALFPDRDAALQSR
jgi:hypothetical protein